jgi:hypothetical protein
LGQEVTVHPRQVGVEVELQAEIVAMVQVTLGSNAASPPNANAAAMCCGV